MPPKRPDKRSDFDSHDTAQICLNGHWIIGTYHDAPGFRQEFCKACGAKTVTKCEQCGTEITGFYRNSAPIDLRPYVPGFCHTCGTPYPWTLGKLKAGQQLADDLLELTVEEREQLKASIYDISSNTPATELAALRIKRFIAKLPKEGADALRRFAVDVASEIGKKALTGP